MEITSITYLLLLFIIGILLPINGVLSGKRIKAFLSESPDGLLMFFKQTVVIQIILAVLVIGALIFNGDSLNEIGLSFVFEPIAIIGLLLACVLGMFLLWHYNFEPHKLKKEIEHNEAIRFLLPSNENEYRWSIGASFAAGICEEIVYRGFLYWMLIHFMHFIPAIFIANLIFGLCHYGTGFKNAFLAFSLGLLLSTIFLFTESLWVLMLIHVLIDIYSMTKGKRYFEQNPVETMEQNIV